MNFSRLRKYIAARTLSARWNLLSKGRKAYVRHLVQDFGWPVDLAIQQAYLSGYDRFTFDYRAKRAVVDSVPANRFGLRCRY